MKADLGSMAVLWAGDQQVIFQLVLRAVLLVVLGFVAVVTARPVRPEVDALFQRLGPGPRWPVPGYSDKTFSLSATVVSACLCGLVVGFLGIGGGVVYLPLLVVAVGIQPIYAVRIGIHWRAVGVRTGDTVVWYWIGSHSDYDTLLASL